MEWNPQISGNYYIYVDVMDEKGTVKTVRQAYSIIKNRWTYEGINQKEYTQKLGEPITFTPETIGNTKGLQYKFVWMRDNWKEWKILQDFSEKKKLCLRQID